MYMYNVIAIYNWVASYLAIIGLICLLVIVWSFLI